MQREVTSSRATRSISWSSLRRFCDENFQTAASDLFVTEACPWPSDKQCRSTFRYIWCSPCVCHDRDRSRSWRIGVPRPEDFCSLASKLQSILGETIWSITCLVQWINHLNCFCDCFRFFVLDHGSRIMNYWLWRESALSFHGVTVQCLMFIRVLAHSEFLRFPQNSEFFKI